MGSLSYLGIRGRAQLAELTCHALLRMLDLYASVLAVVFSLIPSSARNPGLRGQRTGPETISPDTIVPKASAICTPALESRLAGQVRQAIVRVRSDLR